MENDKYIAILLSKQIINNQVIYAPRRVINGDYRDNLFITKEGKEYSTLIAENNNDKEIVSFIIENEILKQVYQENNIKNIKRKYLDDVKKYIIINDKGDINFLYLGDRGKIIISPNDFSEHFVKHLNNPEDIEEFSPDVLYNNLKLKIYGQDEAIKKVFLGLSLQYIDSPISHKSNLIIDGDKGTGKSEIVNVLKDTMPNNVFVENLGDINFSFDSLFLSLYNLGEMKQKPILVLDNADKLLLSKNLSESKEAIRIIKHLMLGIDYKLKTNFGIINYSTKDFTIIILGDFSKRRLSGINNYVEGVPTELSKLTNYNIHMNPITSDIVYQKLMDGENGIFANYKKFIEGFNINLLIETKIVDKIIDEVMASNMHELNKIVEKCFEELIFELMTTDKQYYTAGISTKTVDNNKVYYLK